MQKDFTQWNIKKTNIDTIEVRPFFHVREVWYCYLGVTESGFDELRKKLKALLP